MAKIVASKADQRATREPLYDIDPRTGASVEVFFADRVLARSFGKRPGWFWWSCRTGLLPDGVPTGPFATSYAVSVSTNDDFGSGPFGDRSAATGLHRLSVWHPKLQLDTQ
jgi:hypothetical protein